MECKELQGLLHCLVDDELPPAVKSEATAHTADCADCGPLVAQERQWCQAVRFAGTYHTAPDLLRRRVQAMARQQSAPRARSAWPGWRVAASLLVTVGFTSAVSAYVATPSPGALVEQELVASHVRSLQMEHMTDVASSDQHTVKPWFHGKLDYAPPVEDYGAQGFPLLGGRLDYLDHQNVAALVYRYAQHPINVFILPSNTADSAPAPAVDHDYNLLRWTKDRMTFWAISDANAGALADLGKLLRHETSESEARVLPAPARHIFE